MIRVGMPPMNPPAEPVVPPWSAAGAALHVRNVARMKVEALEAQLTRARKELAEAEAKAAQYDV